MKSRPLHLGLGCSSLDLPLHGLAPLGWCWFYLTTPCLPFHLPLNQPIFFRGRIKKTKNLFFIFFFALTRSFCRSRVKNGFDSVSLCLDFCSWDAWTHTFMHSTVSEWASPWTEWASEVKIVKRSAAYTSAHRVEKSSRSMTSAATRFFGSYFMWGDGLRPKSNHPWSAFCKKCKIQDF